MRTWLIVTATAVTGADLTVKTIAAQALPGRRTVDLPGPLDLRVLFNPGAAFGLGAAMPAAAVIVGTGLLVVAVAVYAWRAVPTLATAGRVGLGLVLGGAAANLIDRVGDGLVTDYLQTGWWPTFNLADIAIVSGAGLLILATLRPDPTRPQP